MATYSRPVKATLHVHLDNGETWEATVEDYEKFNLVDRHVAYMAFDDTLGRVLGDAGLIERRDVTRAALNPLRYLVETAVVNPALLNQEDHDGWAEVVELERYLQHRLAPSTAGES